MSSMQCNVDVGNQLSICSRTEEKTHRKRQCKVHLFYEPGYVTHFVGNLAKEKSYVSKFTDALYSRR
jgi:hypothetical protein